MFAVLATSAEYTGSSSQVFQVDAFGGLVVSVAVQLGVEFVAAVDNRKQFPFDVCVS